MFLQQESLRTELHGIVVPVGRLTVCSSWCRRAFVLDWIHRSLFFFDEVELASQTKVLRSQRDAAGVDNIAFLARPIGRLSIVDATVFNDAVCDIFVDDH